MRTADSQDDDLLPEYDFASMEGGVRGKYAAKLKGSTAMKLPSTRSIPPSVVIPELAYSNVSEAADWLCHAFGFVERLRIGNHRVQLTYGGGAIVVTEQRVVPES